MIIGFLLTDIHLPYCHSLKEKRKRLNSIKERIKNKYNIALAELEYQNKWQRTKIGIVTLNNELRVIESIFQKIIQDLEEQLDGEIIDYKIQWLWTDCYQ